MLKMSVLFEGMNPVQASDRSLEMIDAFKAELKGRNVIVYGAGIVGATLLRALREMNVAVSLVIDKNAMEIAEIEGFSVSAPDALQSVANPDAHLLIIAAGEKPTKSILSDLVGWGVTFDVVENGAVVAELLQCAVCAERFASGGKIEHAKCSDCSFLDNICPALRKAGMKLRAFDEGRHAPGKSKLVTMIGYALGNVCTLNCRHCCESVPMYASNKRSFVNTETVIADIEHLASAAEFVTLIEFIGGEPFLHPGLAEIVRSSLRIQNAAFVRIFTNGTVVPAESLLSALSDSRVAVYISNYTGELNATQTERLTETKRVLQNAGVAFIYGGYKKWFDFSSYDFQPDSDEELAARFNACFLHTCNRLHNGVLYACPHQYAGRNLGILSDCGDTVKLDGDDLIKALDEFKTRPFVDACKHCQMPFKAPVIFAGEAL